MEVCRYAWGEYCDKKNSLESNRMTDCTCNDEEHFSCPICVDIDFYLHMAEDNYSNKIKSQLPAIISAIKKELRSYLDINVNKKISNELEILFKKVSERVDIDYFTDLREQLYVVANALRNKIEHQDYMFYGREIKDLEKYITRLNDNSRSFIKFLYENKYNVDL